MRKSLLLAATLIFGLIPLTSVVESQSLITKAPIDLNNEEILIIGSNLGPNPDVFMGAETGVLNQLNVTSSGPNFAVADLLTTVPGTYVVLVVNGPSVGFTNVTIGPNMDPLMDGLCQLYWTTGNNPPVNLNCPNLPKTAFATSMSYGADLGGVIPADFECQELADIAGLPGLYKAWISEISGSSPATRFNRSTGPYLRTDGIEIAADWNDLTDGTLGAPLNVNEDGVALLADSLTWTATSAMGVLDVGSNSTCGVGLWVSRARDLQFLDVLIGQTLGGVSAAVASTAGALPTCIASSSRMATGVCPGCGK